MNRNRPAGVTRSSRCAARGWRHDLSLTLRPGELTALIGPNGAGKSTLLRLLSGRLTPDRGYCELNARRLEHWSATELGRLRAVMRQSTPSPAGWTAESMIAAGRSPWGRLPPLPMVRQIMALTGCTPLAGRDIARLSGGEQQRVQLARARTQLWRSDGPQGWLFLDEPTSALDLQQQQQLLVLHQGTLIADGSPREVLTSKNLARWFGADVEVVSHITDGAPWVRLRP